MSKKAHVSETPATQMLRANGVAFTEHPYEYLEHGGAQRSAQVLRLDPFWSASTPRSASGCSMPSRCSARWQNSRSVQRHTAP